jgi:hypothetical protein
MPERQTGRQDGAHTDRKAKHHADKVVRMVECHLAGRIGGHLKGLQTDREVSLAESPADWKTWKTGNHASEQQCTQDGRIPDWWAGWAGG